MTPTTICVKTKEMCENFPGKVDPPKKCVKRTICAQILSAKTAPKAPSDIADHGPAPLQHVQVDSYP